MGFKDTMKSIGKATANTFLDKYASESKRLGRTENVEAANNLKDLVNGKVDWQGNPIERRNRY